MDIDFINWSFLTECNEDNEILAGRSVLEWIQTGGLVEIWATETMQSYLDQLSAGPFKVNTISWSRISFVFSWLSFGLLAPLLLKAHPKRQTPQAKGAVASLTARSRSQTSMRRRIYGKEIHLRWGKLWSDIFSLQISGIHEETKEWGRVPLDKTDNPFLDGDGFFNRVFLFFSSPKVTIFNAALMNIVFVMILYGYSITGQTYKFKKFDYFVLFCILLYVLSNFR